MIYFDGERLGTDSCEGCQQGDPLGPFLFAFAFHATLCQVAREYTDCTFVVPSWPTWTTSRCSGRQRAPSLR